MNNIILSFYEMESLDKFYTKKELADSYLSKIQEQLKIEKSRF